MLTQEQIQYLTKNKTDYEHFHIVQDLFTTDEKLEIVVRSILEERDQLLREELLISVAFYIHIEQTHKNEAIDKKQDLAPKFEITEFKKQFRNFVYDHLHYYTRVVPAALWTDISAEKVVVLKHLLNKKTLIQYEDDDLYQTFKEKTRQRKNELIRSGDLID